MRHSHLPHFGEQSRRTLKHDYLDSRNIAVYRGISDADKLHLVVVLLKDMAGDWFDNLQDVVKSD